MTATAAPWLAPLGPGLAEVLAACQAAGAVQGRIVPGDGVPGGDVAAVLNAQCAARPAPPRLAAGPLCFVPQAALPAGEAYEAFIHRRAQVPTRNNLHDAFNGLVWLAQPRLKRRLNAWQAAAIAANGVGATRGPLRDALTLFDENGALLDAPAPLADALRRRDWTALFISHRALWAQARLTLVGHALLEKLATAPRKGLTAHVLLVGAAGDVPDALSLAPAAWAAKPFAPLPVLGVPGWCPANTQPEFYDDAAVFRPPRLQPAQVAQAIQAAQATQAGRKPSIDR